MKNWQNILAFMAVVFGATGVAASFLALMMGWTLGTGVFSPVAYGATGLTYFVVMVVGLAYLLRMVTRKKKVSQDN